MTWVQNPTENPTESIMIISSIMTQLISIFQLPASTDYGWLTQNLSISIEKDMSYEP